MFSMAIMIASAVFECLPYQWVLQAAEKLYESFDKKEEEEKQSGITYILSQFGAKICQGEIYTYTGKTQIEVVRFLKKEYSEKILKFIWREYPHLQDKIVLWLKEYGIRRPMSMSKRANQIMGLLAHWDYYFFPLADGDCI